MKYLVVVQGTQADYEGMRGRATPHAPVWSEDDLKSMYAYMGAINAELAETGELVDAQGLAEPARIRLVTRGAQGRTVIVDDPYDVVEVLPAGYWVLDCASLERVTEIAERVTRCPAPDGVPDLPVVIRPLLDGADDIQTTPDR
ncbi:YciI family protein [Streptomyces pharetrae]|uniref:YCII-related domain-containing protein n=1 Tax=Streptomyces pharetrae CZA14 TaxID=1144883 RepID=A0ABX3YLQ9_9ACTN|nr:hypothetical protein OQI_08430 [Streptomyces pharetrae CZA14]